jgi:hypothetical protein
MGLIGHGPHLAIHVLCELEYVLWIGAAQVIGLVEYLNPHTGVAGFLNRRMFGRSGHVYSREISLPLALA